MGRLATLLFVLPLILLGSLRPAAAQEAPIRATTGATLLPDTPRRARFTLEASSQAGELTEARLFFQPMGSGARISEPIQFAPAARVELSHEWQMQQNGIPPGAHIEYFWRLTDSAGNSFETPRQSFVPLDPRFDWQTVEDDELAISWYDGGEAWGQAMFDTGKEALAQLEAELGADVTRQVRLVAYANRDDFRGAFPPQQDWIGGQAFPDLGVTVQIIAAGEQDWMRTVLFHELSHLVFSQALEGSLVRTPSWLDEGLAMYNEPDELDSFGRDSATRVREAAAANELLPFSQLQGNFGADGQTVGLAYAQSEMLVTYLIDDCGTEGFQQFVQNLVDDMRLDNALEAACGYDSQDLYTAWRQTLPNAPTTDGDTTAPDGATAPATDAGATDPYANAEPPSLLIILLLGGLCFIGILVLIMVFIVIRLIRPQGGTA